MPLPSLAGTRGDRLFWVFTGAAALIAALSALGAGDGPATLLGAPCLALLVVAAVAVGIVRWQPEDARAWWWICAGVGFLFAAELASWVYDRLGATPFPSIADAFHLAAYPALAAGLVTIAAARREIRDRSAILDASIVAAAAALVLWLLIVGAYATNPNLSGLQKAIAVSYPGADVLLVALTVSLLLASRTRSAALVLLFVGLSALVVSDTLVAVGNLRVGFSSDVDEVWRLVAFVLIGMAGLHLSVAQPVEPAEGALSVRPQRLALLVTAAVVPPLLGLTHQLGWWDARDATIAVALATIVVSTLVLVRMWALVRLIRLGVELRGRNRFEQMIRHSQDVVTIVQPDGRLDYASPASQSQWGFEPDERLGTDLGVLIPSDDVHQLREHLALASALPDEATHTFEVHLRRRDGIVREMEVVATNLLADPEIGGLVLTFHDATAQKTLERELAHQAFHDSLTGLANRAMFFDRVEHALERHRRTPDDKVAVLFIDLDDFKSVNDGLGHAFGDELLVAVGERLHECVRPGDTAARLGGDEFAILLDRDADLDTATTVAERLLEVLQLPVSVGELEIAVPASIGIAVAEPEVTPQDLLRDADIAMYSAKARGKRRYIVFNRSMRERAARRLEFRAELNGALDREELVLEYQPIIDVASSSIVAVEALLRWNHPTRGVIPPLEFIPYAEESGLILPIGRWVISTACAQGAAWRRETGRSISVAVNLSGTQLSDPDLVAHVRDALQTTGLPPELLVLELTETVLMEDTQHTIRVLQALKQIGVRISVDDFGTGYCSLAYLRRFPVDDIKIDRSFVEELGRLPTSGTLAASIVTLADALGVAAVAEGVETAEQLSILRDLECQFAQGFLMSRPIEPDAVAQLLARTAPAPVPAHGSVVTSG
jgi:diguanylate cyclase (GGDEF)-like protein/PAS domain S-box-containing protein